jgi:hypothetical protein
MGRGERQQVDIGQLARTVNAARTDCVRVEDGCVIRPELVPESG